MYQANQVKLPALGLLTCQCGREETRQQNESCRGSAVLWALVSVRTEWPRGYQEEEPGRQRGGPREGSEDWREVGTAGGAQVGALGRWGRGVVREWGADRTGP